MLQLTSAQREQFNVDMSFEGAAPDKLQKVLARAGVGSRRVCEDLIDDGRVAQVWPKVCPELAKGPQLLAVGDLHVENFGTWRDAEARVVWGINDVDEAHVAAWPNDLVRLIRATTAPIARRG